MSQNSLPSPLNFTQRDLCPLSSDALAQVSLSALYRSRDDCANHPKSGENTGKLKDGKMTQVVGQRSIHSAQFKREPTTLRLWPQNNIDIREHTSKPQVQPQQLVSISLQFTVPK